MNNSLSPYQTQGTVAAYSTGPLTVQSNSQFVLGDPFFTDTRIYQDAQTTSGNFCNRADGKLNRYKKVGGKSRKNRRNSTKKRRSNKKRTSKNKTRTNWAEWSLLDLLDIWLFL